MNFHIQRCNMNFWLLLFFLVCIFCKVVENEEFLVDNDVTGYYWRDYTGEIPEDALPAGRDVNGNTLYIGQVLHGGLLIPGQVKELDKEICFNYWHQELKTTENIKIFCTRHPEQFKWIKTNNEDFDSLRDKRLVLGGFQKDYTTYIGKLTTEEETSIGKVMCAIDGNKDLHVVKNGKAISYNSFEVLSYEPDTSPEPNSKTFVLTNGVLKPTEKPEAETGGACVTRIINITIV